MTLEFFIKLREMVSSGLVKMANTARNTTNAIRGANGQLAQSYDQIRNRIDALESSIAKSRSVSYIREARRELTALQRQASLAPGNLARGGLGLSGLRGLLPALGIAGGLALGTNVMGAGLTGQARQVSFEVMAGRQQGTALNQNLTKFAQDSIYGNEVYAAAQTMMGFGIAAPDVMKSIKMLGDVAMGDADKLGRLTLAFSQVKAAGKLMGQDLLQFVNAGFNPLQTISEKTGKSIGRLRKEMENGQISFEMVRAAFESATGAGGRFFDMTNRIAQTDYGKVQAFKGQLDGLALQVGGLLAPVLGNLIENYLKPFVNWMGKAVTWINENRNWLGLLVTTIGTALVAYKLWTAAQALLNFTMALNPIAAIVAGIVAFGAAIIYAWNKIEVLRGSLVGIWEVMKQVFSNIATFFRQTFGPIFEAIDAFKSGDFGKAAKLSGQALWNITGPGLIQNAAQFAMDGGFTNGVTDAFKRGYQTGTTSFQIARAEEGRARRKSMLDEFRANRPGGAATANPATNPFSGMATTSAAEETVSGITSGGPRVININGVKFTEKIEIHTTTLEKGLDGIKDQLDEYFLRLLNSGAALQ